MSRKRAEQKKMYKHVARHRIRYLFSLAENCALQGQLNEADRYVTLARRLSMKYLVPIPSEYKRRFCTHCYRYILPGVTCRVRIHRGMIITYCCSCNNVSRMPLHTDSTSPRQRPKHHA